MVTIGDKHMPIDLRTHDPDAPIDIKSGTNAAAIIRVMYTSPHLGYTPSELREQTDIPSGSVSTTLRRLQEKGYIGKTTDGYYHALADREDIRRFATSLVSLEEMAEQYPEAALSLEDVEQVGEPPKQPIPDDRLDTAHSSSRDEPAIDEWADFDPDDSADT